MARPKTGAELAEEYLEPESRSRLHDVSSGAETREAGRVFKTIRDQRRSFGVGLSAEDAVEPYDKREAERGA